MPAGQPPKYKSVKELEKAIDAFFADPPTHKIVVNGETREVPCITITGLVLRLGFVNRQSFYDYENNGKFSDTIKKARTYIENSYEVLLQHGNTTGAIFALKNQRLDGRCH
jgi:hypothetical protein